MDTESTDPTTSSSATLSTNAEAQPLSKNAQKRLAKAARLAEQKKERRAYERVKKKEKRKALAEKRAAGELEDGTGENGARKKARIAEGKRTPFDARIVVDLGFDDLMSDNEIKSLTSQLAFTYSAHRRAVHPFSSVLFTSLEKRTYTRLEGMNGAAYRRWHDTEWWQDSYERLWQSQESSSSRRGEASGSGDAEKEHGEDDARITQPTTKQTASQDTVVYLTADSDEELSELKEGETYIIGGICDHNRYRNLCLKKSQASGIRSARLPIGTYLAELRTRKVLTVNQTFDILLKWVETRDWRKAMEEVVPKRKFNDKGKGSRRSEPVGQDGEDIEAPLDEDGEKVVIDAAALEEEDVDDPDEDGVADANDGNIAEGGDLGAVVAGATSSDGKYNSS